MNKLIEIIVIVSFAFFILHGFTFAQKSKFTEQEVTFENRGVTLAGTIMMPSGEGPFPAVVFLHGSGPHPRVGFRPYAEAFAKLGFASLFFDKRGSGSSDGSWTTSSLEDLAGDALAAVQLLKNSNGIDPNKIGFWGVSQAAWVAPIAASGSADIAFMILISGGGVTPKASELFSYEKEFEKAGLTPQQKEEAFEVLHVYFRYLETGEDRAGLVSKLENLKNTWMAPLAEKLLRVVPSEKNRPNWEWVAVYDPVSDIEKLKMPILLMFGDLDTDQPTDVAIKHWREGLAKAGNKNFSIKVFPGAGHGIRMGSEHSHSAPFAEGYHETMQGWLKEINTSK